MHSTAKVSSVARTFEAKFPIKGSIASLQKPSWKAIFLTVFNKSGSLVFNARLTNDRDVFPLLCLTETRVNYKAH